MEINTKFYEDIAIKSTPYYPALQTALEVVNKFLIRNHRILVGGMSIDYALKLKGHKGIYDDSAIPDYDFFSEQHYRDAYEIAKTLYKKGIREISVINAMHPSTIKVRVNYVTIADITYIPPNIFKSIPTLNYKGISIIHPHVQMIDQHLTLARLYQNAPREVILSGRVNKDMKRHDMLYEQYPLVQNPLEQASLGQNQKDGGKPQSFNIFDLNGKIFLGQCISGLVALNYWTKYAADLGYTPKYKLGEFDVGRHKNTFLVSMPKAIAKLLVYSNDPKSLLAKLFPGEKTRGNAKYFNAFVDKFPRHIEVEYAPFDAVEIYDNNYFMAASTYGDSSELDSPGSQNHSLYFANLQQIMAECLKEILFFKKEKEYVLAYLQARDIVTWASKLYTDSKDTGHKDKLRNLLLVDTYYGALNQNMPYHVAKYRFDIKNANPSGRSKLPKLVLPKAVYDLDISKGVSHKFNYEKSEVFNFDGKETKPFLYDKNKK